MKRRANRWQHGLTLLVSLLLSSGATQGAEQAPPSLSITLRPLVLEGSVAGLAVEQSIEGVHADATTALLELPLVIYNVPTAAESLTALTVRDATGQLTLDSRDEGKGAATVRRWFTNRPVDGTVHVRYEAAMRSHREAPRHQLSWQCAQLRSAGALLGGYTHPHVAVRPWFFIFRNGG